MCRRTCLVARGHDQHKPDHTDGRYSRTRKSLGCHVFHPRHQSSLRGCFSKPQSEVQHVQGWQSPNDKVGHSVAEYDGARNVFSLVLATLGDRRNLEEIRRIPPTPRPKTTHGHRGGSGCRPLSNSLRPLWTSAASSGRRREHKTHPIKWRACGLRQHVTRLGQLVPAEPRHARCHRRLSRGTS